MKIGTGPLMVQRVQSGAKSATFTTTLPAGPTRLYTWFYDGNRQPLLGAYYVYVKRK